MDMDVVSLQRAVQDAYDRLGIDARTRERDALQLRMQSADFWQDNLTAQQVSKQHAALDERVTRWTELRNDCNEVAELASFADVTMRNEIEQQVRTLNQRFAAAKRELLFNGPYDSHSVILRIFAGAGGVDAQDWAQMLLRMYTRWAERHNLSTHIIDQSSGEEAGLKSVTIELSGGSFLYGKTKGEHGVHRLVRLSPFNADNLRQTSFARVEVMPKVESPEEVNIDEHDLQIDVFRSGGKGGQSVNTTDSAVRITHLPTGIVVVIQNERSQLQNKETALTIVRSKLAQLQLEQHKEHLNELKGPNEQAAWGNQIRNYVLHPYSLVKDTRSKYETSDVQSVLDGNLDDCIAAYLDSQISKSLPSAEK